MNYQDAFEDFMNKTKGNVKCNRIWSMPDKWTFKIKPIYDIVNQYVGDGGGWADPFAGFNSPAEFTNDLNPDSPARYHIDAKEFAQAISKNLNGVLFDPPYSPRQISECYKAIGREVHMEDTQSSFYSTVKDLIAPKIRIGGYAICCGWNTNGFGLTRGFELVEILLVPHGGVHNDTIVTVERKTQGELF